MRIEIKPPADIDVDALEDEMLRAVEATLKGAAQIVLNDSRAAIARGPKTGTVYKRRGIRHQASAPGEPPATDTGSLASSGVADAKGLEAFVVYRMVYAKWLEYGTRHIAPRPFLFPAAERNRQRIGDMVRLAIQTAWSQWQSKRRT